MTGPKLGRVTHQMDIFRLAAEALKEWILDDVREAEEIPFDANPQHAQGRLLVAQQRVSLSHFVEQLSVRRNVFTLKLLQYPDADSVVTFDRRFEGLSQARMKKRRR